MIKGKTDNTQKRLRAYLRRANLKRNRPGRLECLAIRRHQLELELARDKTYQWVFDPFQAQLALDFFPTCLCHGAGQFAGQPFELEPWEAFIVSCLFGWRRRRDGARRFRKAMLSVARKNGKTQLAAAISLAVFFADYPPDPMAELYFTGPKGDQAHIAHRAALAMIEHTPALNQRVKIRADRILLPEFNSYLKPLKVGPTHGLNPSLITIDELHEWRQPHRAFLDALTTSGAARLQQLLLYITTAGDDTCDLWVEEDQYARDVVEAACRGNPIDDRYFSFICRIDEDDDPFDERAWHKANPNLEVSVSLEYLRDQANEAKHKSTSRATFIRFHCNRQTGAAEPMVSEQKWALGAAELPDDLLAAPAYLGLDLGRVYDFAAATICFGERDEEGKPSRFGLLSQCWCSSSEKMRPLLAGARFRQFVERGELIVHEGDSVDFAAISDFIREWLEVFGVRGVVFDPHSALEMAGRLYNDTGIDCRAFPQTPRAYNEPIKRFLADLGTGKILHGSNECLTWQALNCSIKRNPADLWMPDKRHQSKKIDGFVAGLMAYERCLYEMGSISYHQTNPVEWI